MRGPFVDPLAIAMARKLGGGGGGVKPSGEIAIDKNGTYDVTQYASANVNVSGGGGGGGGGDSSKPVRFLDYDGTVVQSYTAEEFATLEAMPENPDHSDDEIPLTAQGWNWSLADAKAYVAKYGALEVGQMYITTDGKTHIKIYIDPSTPANRRVMGVRFAQSVANGVTIDWGDGTTPENRRDTAMGSRDHTYAQVGWYDITLTVTAGTIAFSGSSMESIVGGFSGKTANKRAAPRVIRLGSGLLATAIGEYAFGNCRALENITIPNNITAIGEYAFTTCSSLRSITIPHGVTTIGSYAFNSSASLRTITLPNGVTNLNSSTFQSNACITSIAIPNSVTTIANTTFSNCYGLTKITIPEGVTAIGSSAFYNLSEISEFHVLPITPPTIQSNTFSSIASDCIIYVPAASVEDYKAATNWSAQASRIQAEPA